MAVALLERRTDVAAAHQPPRAYRGPSFPTAGNPELPLSVSTVLLCPTGRR